MSLVRRLIDAHFAVEDGTLLVGGARTDELAREFGTPCYVFCASVFARTVRAVLEALGPRVNLLYALKANPSLAVASRARTLGTGAEIASGGELALALAAGFNGADIQFAGPGKDAAELQEAVARGVLLNVESEGELRAVAALATPDQPARIALRVNPPRMESGARMRMGGGSAKFGIDLDQVPELSRIAGTTPSLCLEGLHMYAGTQTFDHAAWVQQAETLLRAADQVENGDGSAPR